MPPPPISRSLAGLLKFCKTLPEALEWRARLRLDLTVPSRSPKDLCLKFDTEILPTLRGLESGLTRSHQKVKTTREVRIILEGLRARSQRLLDYPECDEAHCLIGNREIMGWRKVTSRFGYPFPPSMIDPYFDYVNFCGAIDMLQGIPSPFRCVGGPQAGLAEFFEKYGSGKDPLSWTRALVRGTVISNGGSGSSWAPSLKSYGAKRRKEVLGALDASTPKAPSRRFEDLATEAAAHRAKVARFLDTWRPEPRNRDRS